MISPSTWVAFFLPLFRIPVAVIALGCGSPVEPTLRSRYAIGFTQLRYVVVMEEDRTGVDTIATTDQAIACASASPDGTRLIIQKAASNPLFMIDLRTAAEAEFPTVPTVGACPAWSPDGLKIAYTGWSSSATMNQLGSGLFISNADGTGGRMLRADGFAGNLPLGWSPDAKLLVASSTELHLVIIDAATGDVVQTLTRAPGYDFAPSWSPDNRSIVFGGVIDSIGADIYSIAPDNSSVRRLTQSPPGSFGGNNFPTWSPDGSEIVFSRVTSPTQSMPFIARIGPDGTELPWADHRVVFGGQPFWIRRR